MLSNVNNSLDSREHHRSRLNRKKREFFYSSLEFEFFLMIQLEIKMIFFTTNM